MTTLPTDLAAQYIRPITGQADRVRAVVAETRAALAQLARQRDDLERTRSLQLNGVTSRRAREEIEQHFQTQRQAIEREIANAIRLGLAHCAGPLEDAVRAYQAAAPAERMRRAALAEPDRFAALLSVVTVADERTAADAAATNDWVLAWVVLKGLSGASPSEQPKILERLKPMGEDVLEVAWRALRDAREAAFGVYEAERVAVGWYLSPPEERLTTLHGLT
nr:hypothetical protein [Gemmatimonadaceae bacterium]